jgi:hypothetical protein
MISEKRGWWRFDAQIKELGQDVCTRVYWKRIGPSLAAECRSSLQSILTILRRAGWWRTSAYLSCYAAVFVLCLFLPLYSLMDFASQFTGDTCLPDGRFSLGSNYSLWDISGIFQISMGFGAFSFSNAKLLDAVWDVVSDQSDTNTLEHSLTNFQGCGPRNPGFVGHHCLQGDDEESVHGHGAPFCSNWHIRGYFVARFHLCGPLQANSQFSIHQKLAAQTADIMDNSQHAVHCLFPHLSGCHDRLCSCDGSLCARRCWRVDPFHELS